jgi:SGS domain
MACDGGSWRAAGGPAQCPCGGRVPVFRERAAPAATRHQPPDSALQAGAAAVTSHPPTPPCLPRPAMVRAATGTRWRPSSRSWRTRASWTTATRCQASSKRSSPRWVGGAQAARGGWPPHTVGRARACSRLSGQGDDDTRRAMMKSYTESNGTVLSTNWQEVGGPRAALRHAVLHRCQRGTQTAGHSATPVDGGATCAPRPLCCALPDCADRLQKDGVVAARGGHGQEVRAVDGMRRRGRLR